MSNIQLIGNIFKKPAFILFLIIFSFFLKEVFLATVYPIFIGQDEARHYNTIQYLAEPKEKNWEISQEKSTKKKNNFDSYNFSEEIKGAGNATGVGAVRGSNPYDKMDFTPGFIGKNEKIINSKPWEALNKNYPPEITGKGHQDLYHILGSGIEKILSQKSIFVRFYSIRIFSVLLGALTILLSYFIFKNIGLKEKESLIFSAVISFQPKLSVYLTNINYFPLLLLAFSLFTLGAVLSLKNDLNWKNLLLMIASITIGLFTKGTAIVLIPVFLVLVIYHLLKNNFKNKIKLRQIILVTIPIVLVIAIFLVNYNLSKMLPYAGSLKETVLSLFAYLSKSLPDIPSSATNYWGDLDWVRHNYIPLFIWIIWIAEFFSAIGVALLFFRKKEYPKYLPQKKYLILFLGMIIALQLGVRMADWSSFIQLGRIELGTPGRYFLPTIISHFALISIGLKVLLKKNNLLEIGLYAWLIIMFSFQMFSIFSVIIPRFYL